MKGKKQIKYFSDNYAFLSNFHKATIKVGEIYYPTAEHLYQACKTNDAKEKMKVSLAATPGKAKRIGQKVTLIDDWNSIKVEYMLYVLKEKFKQNKDLSEKLLSTNNAILIEGNYWHDNFWGDCQCKRCSVIEGQNYLGLLLMEVREGLKNER